MRARTYINICICLTVVSLVASCAIKDDIPYPIVEGAITAFEVEGQCDAEGNEGGTAEINQDARTVRVYVNDLVDVSDLRIKRLEVTNDALIIKDSVVYGKSDKYFTKGYTQTGSLGTLRADFTRDATFTLRTYQDYEWKVSVHQIIDRNVEIEGQVGNAVIDDYTRMVVVYVSEKKDLRALEVHKFSLGGQHGTVTPDPTSVPTYDFSLARKFYVREGWRQSASEWTVYVYPTEEKIEPSIRVSTNEKGAIVVSGERPNGVTPTLEYREDGSSVWTTVPQSEVRNTTSTSYEVVLNMLHSDVKYFCRASFGGNILESEPFYFIGEQLENNSFDNWHIEGEGKKALYCPWGENETPYWDTGNHGATTVGASNSTYVDEEGRRYANLQSKYIVVKFAAGNIFTGKYLETDGTNGVLSFGRPFTSRPTKMQFDFQYKTSTITKTGGEWKDPWGKYISRQLYEGLKGKPDSCSVYIALGDWAPEVYVSPFSSVRAECPYLIRTRPKEGELHLLDMSSPNLIGFAQMTCGEDVSSWTTETIDIHYYNNRVPTTVIVVAASSKYGDYFTGGETSLLKIDDLKLIY